MLDFKNDRPKTMAQIRKDLGKGCMICGKPLTQMQGVGSEILCREHQLQQREYGGLGRTDRPHTFHRKWVCDDCGIDVPAEMRRRRPGLEEQDPDAFWRACRDKLIGDHKQRKADGGDDSAANIQCLCLWCNSDKTILNEDYRPGTELP